MRIAIVHHWFVAKGGGERVAELLARLFPEADIFTLVADPEMIPESLRNRTIHASFISRLPLAPRIYRHLLPLYPLAVEQLDLSGYDLVLSSDSGPMKGVIISPAATHICYCHAPMRYIWDQSHTYRRNLGRVSRMIFDVTAHYMRSWDYLAAQRVTHFVANSHCVAARIRQYYGRQSKVIYPPIDLSAGYLAGTQHDSYLTVGRLVPYKRVDVLIEACNRLGRKLRIVGEGPEEKRLRALAGKTIEFLGTVDEATLWKEYAECRAFLFAADEDFGMAVVEAQACGRPVVAFGKGGALESVTSIDSVASSAEWSGLFYLEQTPQSAMDAIRRFESNEYFFDPAAIRERARRFDAGVFCREMQDLVALALQEELPQPDSVVCR